MLCKQNIIFDKVHSIVAEVKIGTFINCFFCVLLVSQTPFLDKKPYTVCQNSLHFCVRQRTTQEEVRKKKLRHATFDTFFPNIHKEKCLQF